MFASRANQENAVYEQQTAAAAKPLNQGIKGLAPKTPGNKAPKTPFKLPLNDENAKEDRGSGLGKGKKGALIGQEKDAKALNTAFVTPAGPRTRAPLGNKTTNAKTTAFHTPAAVTNEKPAAGSLSPRHRRAKVKVHQAETGVEEDEEEREIEHMPAREVPLPDHPDDWPHDRTYPQFEGNNFTRGWWSAFSKQAGDEDDDFAFSDFEEKMKRLGAQERTTTKATMSTKNNKPVAASPALKKTTTHPLATRAPSTLKSRDAASALTKTSNPRAQPSFAAPTTSTKASVPSGPATKQNSTGLSSSGNPRHTAARVASNSTLGYSKGRAVSNIRRPVSHHRGQENTGGEATQVKATHSTTGGGKMLEDLFNIPGLDLGHDGDDSDLDDNGHGSGSEDEALGDFQLDSVDP